MKRVILVASIVGMLVIPACARHRIVSKHGMADVPDVCRSLDPNENWFLWWFYGCSKDAPGGGGSGAR